MTIVLLHPGVRADLEPCAPKPVNVIPRHRSSQGAPARPSVPTISNRRPLGNEPGQHFSSPSLISSFGLRVKRSRRNVMCCSGIWDQKRRFRTRRYSPAWPTPTSHIPDCRRAQFQNAPRWSVWMTVSVGHKQSIADGSRRRAYAYGRCSKHAHHRSYVTAPTCQGTNSLSP